MEFHSSFVQVPRKDTGQNIFNFNITRALHKRKIALLINNVNNKHCNYLFRNNINTI